MLNTIEQPTTSRFLAALEPGPQEAAAPGPAAGEAPENAPPKRLRVPLVLAGTWVRGAEKFSVTPEDLESIRRNFRERLNGEINVDYDHASETPEVAAGGPIPSAGRIVDIDPPEPAGRRLLLWGWFEPTARARALIASGEYRYISPAIRWSARHKQTGRAQGTTLTSVALTNRPFLEELSQIRLADPEFRLVEPGAEVSDAGGPPEAQTTGGSMKRVQLSVADGKVRVHHPALGEECYLEPADLEACRAALGAGAPEEVPLQQAAAALSESEAEGQSVPAVEVFRARVEQALDEAVRSGKILPRRREDWRRIARADFQTFTRLMAEQPPRLPLRPLGFSGSLPQNAPEQVKFLAEQRMRERNISYGQALSEIGREEPDLVHQYRRAVSGDQ